MPNNFNSMFCCQYEMAHVEKAGKESYQICVEFNSNLN
jgi:L,D-peptidoglycan transpeptidase YkuD (ErfK/YbiS/YcfS/YnhG family)